MESRDLVLRPVFWSLGFGLEGFWSRSRDLRLEILHRVFFMKFCKKEFLKQRFQNLLFKIQPFKEVSG